jgi:hypothetical protein
MAEDAGGARIVPNSPEWPIVPETDFDPSQVIENTVVQKGKKRPPNPSRFKFEQVNEVTWKLTNGELTNVPASHGQWGGYRTTKALAWVICVGPSKWLARYGDMVCGPLSLAKAKAAGMAMAKGAPGDYCLANSICHLNGLSARLIDLDADPFADAGCENAE